ncbi:hypothetical protein KSP35_20255 [Aquihabitans sp. G128]|uniref:hypothetical protein n=1 Tax=Aquihabitans sp. G128 TaxID=2849779 RepID=UPI001C21B1B3|nr:hypothetical protein [Aquihabitans sp. G128]QXC60628.1 hypothetical protein KSP35_20255 [Aquihabitans sp. G128]
MNVATKLGAYSASLVLVFAGALALGSAVGPIGGSNGASHGAIGQDEATRGGHDMAAKEVDQAAGLQISSDGYTLVPTATVFEPGRAVGFSFRIDGPDGKPVDDYKKLHDKELHLIVVRRDLSGYQHVHPVRDTNGTWTVPLDLATPGTYRVMADFKPASSETMSLTLGADVTVPGNQRTTPLPGPASTATVDDYDVTLAGDLVAGEESTLTLSVSKDGEPVEDLQPYLAAYGHLVALRGGDLAYLHVHPDGAPGDGRTKAGPEITFHAQVPSVGTYRLYLDFRHEGQVRTAEFTAEAARRGSDTTPDTHSDGHDQMDMGS